MSTRGTGPPGNGAGPRSTGGDQGTRQQADSSGQQHIDASTVADRPDNPPEERSASPVEAYLLALIARCDDVPLLDELDADDLGTPRATASIARAALVWLTDGTPMAIRRRLLDELDESDRLVIARLGSTHDDIRGDTDWTRVLDVVTARREYRERWGVA